MEDNKKLEDFFYKSEKVFYDIKKLSDARDRLVGDLVDLVKATEDKQDVADIEKAMAVLDGVKFHEAAKAIRDMMEVTCEAAQIGRNQMPQVFWWEAKS